MAYFGNDTWAKANNSGQDDFQELFDRYGQRMYTFAMAYLKDEQEANAVVQQVFDYLKSQIRWDTLSNPEEFNSRLFTLTRDRVLLTLRNRKGKSNTTSPIISPPTSSRWGP